MLLVALHAKEVNMCPQIEIDLLPMHDQHDDDDDEKEASDISMCRTLSISQ